MIEYITCKKCKIQQPRKNFLYNSNIFKVCKYCNKKTNVIPSEFKITTEQIQKHLSNIIYDEKYNTSIFLQTQMTVVFEFLQRQICKEKENKQAITGDL